MPAECACDAGARSRQPVGPLRRDGKPPGAPMRANEVRQAGDLQRLSNLVDVIVNRMTSPSHLKDLRLELVDRDGLAHALAQIGENATRCGVEGHVLSHEADVARRSTERV